MVVPTPGRPSTARGFQEAGHGQQHAVAIDRSAAGADEHGPVGISVKSYAHGGMRFDHGLCKISGCSDPQAL